MMGNIVSFLSTMVIDAVLGDVGEDTTEDLIIKAGFKAETHGVITEDGYILTVHR